MLTLITDTREKNPWTFANQDVQIINQKLDTGDYSLEGLEHEVCIERKRSITEIANNITTKRFSDELIRMGRIRYPFLLLEFAIDDILAFPVNSGIPRTKWRQLRVNSGFILKYLTEIPFKYNVHVVYCNDRDNAEIIAYHLLKQANNLVNNG